MSAVGAELQAQIDRMYPEPSTGTIEEVRSVEPPEGRVEFSVVSEASDYVQSINVEDLISLARERSVVIFIRRSPGDFALPGEPLAELVGDETGCWGPAS